MDIVATAVPWFFLLIGVECAYSILARRHLYRLPDAVTNLGCGLLQQAVGMLPRLAILAAVYPFAWEHWRLADLAGSGSLVWAVAVLGVDHSYYWWHRTHHRSNVLWAIHIVHHQSEDYNLTVALRQTPLAAFTSWVFYLPLAVVGVPPAVFFTAYGINIVYQFWIHTEVVGRLGPLEWVMNTPSHHRVHHGTNPQYLDRNYAGVFIIWDRIYRTFEPEREPVVYGITTPLASWNVLWANTHYYVELWRASRSRRGLWARLRVWLISPERLAADEGRSPGLRVPAKFSSPAGRPDQVFVAAVFAIGLAGTVTVLLLGAELPGWTVWANLVLAIVTLAIVGTRLPVVPGEEVTEKPSSS